MKYKPYKKTLPQTVNPNTLAVIRDSAYNLVVLKIHYVDSIGKLSVREVEPYEIKDNKLWAFCLEKQSIRQFSLTGITDARKTSQPFTPRFPILIQ